MNAVGWFDVYVEDMDRAVGFMKMYSERNS